MYTRKKGFLAVAFEETYQRSLAEGEDSKPLIYSAISGFTGWQYKYAPVKGRTDVVERAKDKNIYNWIEQFVFGIPRLAKNTAKLFTEFMWNAAAAGLVQLANDIETKANARIKRAHATEKGISITDSLVHLAGHTGSLLLKGLSFAPWLIAKIGQSITSPITAMKQTSAYVNDKTGFKLLGGLAAGLRFAFTMAAYATIGMFVLPVVAPALGSTIANGLAVAMNAISTAPVIGPVVTTIGSAFTTALTTVASLLGLSIPSATLATASVIAGTSIIATPVLTGLKAGLRAISPFKGTKPATGAAAPAELQSMDSRSIQSSVEDASKGLRPSAENEEVQSKKSCLPLSSFSAISGKCASLKNSLKGKGSNQEVEEEPEIAPQRVAIN